MTSKKRWKWAHLTPAIVGCMICLAGTLERQRNLLHDVAGTDGWIRDKLEVVKTSHKCNDIKSPSDNDRSLAIDNK